MGRSLARCRLAVGFHARAALKLVHGSDWVGMETTGEVGLKKRRAEALGGAFVLAAVGLAVVVVVCWAIGALPTADYFSLAVMLSLDFAIAAGLILTWARGRAVVEAVPFWRGGPMPLHVRDCALAAALGAPLAGVVMSVFEPVSDAAVYVLVALIVVAWLALRVTRPEPDVRPELLGLGADTPRISVRQGVREQRLAAYLTFLIPAVSVGLLIMVSDEMAPVFAGVGLVFGLAGVAMERFLWAVRWSDGGAGGADLDAPVIKDPG